MAGSLRPPRFRCGLALTKIVACRWDGNDGQDCNDGVREPSVQLRLSLLEHSKQEHADGNFAGRKAKCKWRDCEPFPFQSFAELALR